MSFSWYVYLLKISQMIDMQVDVTETVGGHSIHHGLLYDSQSLYLGQGHGTCPGQ